MDKRKFLKTAGIIGAGVVLSPAVACTPAKAIAATGPSLTPEKFVLPELGYAYNALEPAIDAMTMEIHYSKHHAAYVNNLNNALAADTARYAGKSLETILTEIKPGDTAVRNNGGGHWNHTAFWKWIKPGGAKNPDAALLAAINEVFGSYDLFRQKFEDAAKSRFGSGWAWLCVDRNKKLFVSSSANQDNPLMNNITETPGTPILGLDVWEHAYYLKYQSKRPDYIQAFMGLINWDVVGEMYRAAMSK